MKTSRICKILAFALLLAALSSCAHIFDREYYVEQDYNAGYIETVPDSDIQEVRRYSALRDAIENLVINFSDEGTIRTLNYSGDVEDDVSRAVNYVTRETPLGVYAVDYIRQDSHLYLTYYEITIKIYYKVTREEIAQILHFNTISEMFGAIREDVSDFRGGFIFEISSPSLTERQITEFVENFHAEHPDILTEVPEITVTAYPHWNSIRKIITLDFKYSRSRDSMLAERMMNRWYPAPEPTEPAPDLEPE